MATNYTLESLIADLKNNAYVPKTDAELHAAADSRYTAAYDQKRLEAQQAAETNQLALDRQLSSIGATRAKQKDASATNFAQAYSQANRNATDRSMGRSSYTGATLANIAIAGNKAQQEISDNEALARTGVEDQKTLLAQQLSEQIRQYSAGQAADTLAYLDELESKEYDKSTAAADKSTTLAAQIYQFANQEKTQDEASQQWLQQFNEQTRQFDTSTAESQRQFNVLHPTKSGGQKNRNKKIEDKGNAGTLTYEQVRNILDAYKNGPQITGSLAPTSVALVNARKNKIIQTTK